MPKPVATPRPTGKFHPVAEVSATLPAHYYFDPAIFAREREEIFFKSWQLVGYRDAVAKAGSYFTAELFDQKLLVIRGKDGKLRAFYNVCMHRGHVLAEGHGEKSIFTCPFHAWSYDTTGALKAAGNAENVQDFRLDDFGLAPVRVEEFLNMVFVNLDPDAVPMAKTFKALADEIRSFLPQIDSYQFHRRDVLPLQCNWKFTMDQLECYHCPHIHPEAMQAVDITHRESHEYDWWQSHTSFIDEDKMRRDWGEKLLRSKVGDAFKDNHVWYMWPNYMLLGQPGPANFSILIGAPTSVGTTDVIVEHCFSTAPSPENVKQMNGLRDIVLPQDTAAMNGQQKGIRARGYRQGRLMVDAAHSWRSEHATHHFDKMVWEALNGPRYELE
ncbi:MAG: aromatic ring-hydroxylating dioxygenase subunit alpha [Alphaproteobacteria bacterium]|nr:aromatic ring-hydroxylating dioxygenase subunit alpha [Alphaproteobacteria bacterium]